MRARLLVAKVGYDAHLNRLATEIDEISGGEDSGLAAESPTLPSVSVAVFGYILSAD